MFDHVLMFLVSVSQTHLEFRIVPGVAIHFRALLDNCRERQPVEEMSWDCAAREAVEHAMQRARWDEATREITLFDADDDRIRETVSTREGLDRYLTQVAASAFYANAPRVDGDFLEGCDEYGVLETVLAEYEEQLEDFFEQDAPAAD
jgi:hypothetical protein